MRRLVLRKIWHFIKWTFLYNNATPIYYVIALIFIMADLVTSLQITSLVAPNTADPRYDSPQMTCRYVFGNEGLFTVKWYKDDREFYRYLPTFDPQIIRFPTDEVSLSEDGFVETETTLEKKLASPEICNTTACTIRLVNLTAASAGVYSCEISSERPLYFKTEIRSTNFTLLAPPIKSPTIHTTSSTYTVGDILSATCTSDPSLPSSEIYWMVNGEIVPSHAVMYSLDIAQPDKFGLGRSISQLDLRVEEDHITRSQKGQLNVTCLASVPNTDIKKSSHMLFPLAGPQGVMNDNQRLEWNSGSGKQIPNLINGPSATVIFTVYKAIQLLQHY